MPEYALLILSAFLFSTEFIFVKLFENKNGSSYTSALSFALGSSVIGLPILFICNGFTLGFSWYSLLMAGLLALVSVGANIIGIKAVSIGSVAVYTLFMMLGGMIVPFVVGAAFLHEKVKLWYIIATVLLTGALVLPVFDKAENKSSGKGKKIFWLFIVLCSVLFMLNGANSTIGNLHQNENITFKKVGTVDFLIWKYIFKIVYCGILFFTHRDKGKYKLLVRKSSLLAGAGFAAVHIAATLLQLYCAITVNASLMYPLVTGGTLIFTPILSRIIFKEKLTVFVIAEILISVVATVLFVF
ncbi:MAG: hypothetical protein IJ308_04455 [Clostridia bacterium]|nr:hypothetical protein [Clostridia bacterium]